MGSRRIYIIRSSFAFTQRKEEEKEKKHTEHQHCCGGLDSPAVACLSVSSYGPKMNGNVYVIEKSNMDQHIKRNIIPP